MSDASPPIDFDNLPAPSEGILVTLFLTVRDAAASCDFYSRVLGGTVVIEGTPSMVKLSNSWIIMNSGGGPTPDKPDISVVNYEPGDTTSIFLNPARGRHRGQLSGVERERRHLRHAADRPPGV